MTGRGGRCESVLVDLTDEGVWLLTGLIATCMEHGGAFTASGGILFNINYQFSKHSTR